VFSKVHPKTLLRARQQFAQKAVQVPAGRLPEPGAAGTCPFGPVAGAVRLRAGRRPLQHHGRQSGRGQSAASGGFAGLV